ncbi:MAG: ROK family protein [Candidatus Altiarchaeota archaeon]
MVRTLGVDVGGGSIVCGLVEEGVILHSKTVATGQSPEALVDSVFEAISGVLESSSVMLGDVRGVGLGFPAFMDPASGWYRFPNIPEADDVDLEDMLAGRLKVKFVIGNDADYTALGAVGHLSEFQNMKTGCGSKSIVELVLLTLGTGIGGGVVVKCGSGHEMLSGRGGLTELGHMKVSEDMKYVCGCGSIGCVEATSSCTAIVKAFGQGSDAKGVDELSARGNPVAVQVMAEAGRHLGVAAANILNSFNPSFLAFTGGGANSKAEGVFFRNAMEVMGKMALPEAWEAVSVVKNPDAKRFGVLGAAYKAETL